MVLILTDSVTCRMIDTAMRCNGGLVEWFHISFLSYVVLVHTVNVMKYAAYLLPAFN